MYLFYPFISGLVFFWEWMEGVFNCAFNNEGEASVSVRGGGGEIIDMQAVSIKGEVGGEVSRVLYCTYV